jgi:hypothetical protein
MMIERLERRRLLSVTVQQTSPGYYEVHADDSGNNIAISVSQNDQTFSLDGASYDNVAFIDVYGGAGSDNISLNSVDGAGSIGAAVDSGQGDDNVSMNFDGGIWVGNGNNIIHLQDSFRGEVHTGDGNDKVYVLGDCIDADIMTGNGNDLIDASSNNYGVVIHAGSGNDTIFGSAYDDEIYGGGGSNEIHGNGGNDTFYCQNDSQDTLFGDGGSDSLYGNGTEASIQNVEHIYLLSQ